MTIPFRVSFFVPGQPVGKGRARSFPLMRDRRPVLNKHGRPVVLHHTPDRTGEYERVIRLNAARAMDGRLPIGDPVSVDVRISFRIPKSWSHRQRELAAAGVLLPTTKPDADNVLKAVKDAMNEIVYCDDKQVVDGAFSKRYSVEPGVVITVKAIR